MSLPFTVEQFFALFATYNAAIWPAQVVAYVLGLTAVGALWSDHAVRRRLIFFILAIMWAWNGLVYQFAFFAQINPAAKLFAVLFVLQAILFAASALIRNSLIVQIRPNAKSVLGLGFILYALVLYQWLGYLAGHGLMQGPLFGVAPCPTTIFTIGMLLLARGDFIAWLAILPVMWSLVGTSAAILLGVPEDLGLLVAALALVVTLASERFRSRSPTPQAP